MKPGILRLLSILLLSTAALNAQAQYGGAQFSYGICFGTAAKMGLFQQPRMKYSLWGEANVGMYAALSGANPGSMTARLHVQFSKDDLYIKMGQREAYILESNGLLLNPEVSIPFRNRNGDYKVELLAGIGAHFVADQDLAIRNVDGYFGGSFIDNLADSIFSARRSLQPFVTAGVAFRVHRRGSIVLRVRQDVQNAFDSGHAVTLYSSTDTRTVNLSAQATRWLIGCEIRLGKLPELY
jgi:hypothetical protein